MGNLGKAFDRFICNEILLCLVIPLHSLVIVDLNGSQASGRLDGLHGKVVQADAQGNHDYDRGRSDDYAQNGQKGPKLSAAQIIDAHGEQIKKSHRLYPLPPVPSSSLSCGGKLPSPLLLQKRLPAESATYIY